MTDSSLGSWHETLQDFQHASHTKKTSGVGEEASQIFSFDLEDLLLLSVGWHFLTSWL